MGFCRPFGFGFAGCGVRFYFEKESQKSCLFQFEVLMRILLVAMVLALGGRAWAQENESPPDEPPYSTSTSQGS